VPIADIPVRALLRRGTARAAALPSDRPAKIGHARNYLPKQKGRLTAASPKSDSLQLSLPSGLNNWSFTLADRSLADTTSKAKGQYGRADYNQKFFHGSPISLFYQNLFLSYARIKSPIESGLLHRFALSCDKNVTRVLPDTALTFGHERLIPNERNYLAPLIGACRFLWPPFQHFSDLSRRFAVYRVAATFELC